MAIIIAVIQPAMMVPMNGANRRSSMRRSAFVPAFDPQVLLPDGLRDFVTDIAYRMPCAPEYVAAATIAFAGSVIGARCAIKPKRHDNWLAVPNVWGAIVGDPSQKKSPAISEAAKPVGELIAAARKTHDEALSAAECDQLIREAEHKAIAIDIKDAAKRGDSASLEKLRDKLKAHRAASADEPALRRFKSNNSTVEKLGELLRDNPAGILIVRDELVGLFASWDKQGREGDRQFFLSRGLEPAISIPIEFSRGASLFRTFACRSLAARNPQAHRLFGASSRPLADDGLCSAFSFSFIPMRSSGNTATARQTAGHGSGLT